MLHHITSEIKNTDMVPLTQMNIPLVSYSKKKGLLMIKESENKLSAIHVEAIKSIIGDHLNTRNSIDIVLQIDTLNRVNLPLFLCLFKYCKGLTEWNKRIDIAWFISDEELNLTRIVDDFKELYQLNMRILNIS